MTVRRRRHFRPKRSDNIDEFGFRPNVAVVIQNDHGQVLWAHRVGDWDAWQFPQGGIRPGESPEEAMFRELYEEVGLAPEAVEVLHCTKGWMHYKLPAWMRRRNPKGSFRGQKQKWFLVRLLAGDDAVRTDRTDEPEFDEWRWVSYWYPLHHVVGFKREVYRRGLLELAPHVTMRDGPSNDGPPGDDPPSDDPPSDGPPGDGPPNDDPQAGGD